MYSFKKYQLGFPRWGLSVQKDFYPIINYTALPPEEAVKKITGQVYLLNPLADARLAAKFIRG